MHVACIALDLQSSDLMLKCHQIAVGAERAKRDLKLLKGRSEIVSVLKSKGLADVISLLSSLLPPLVTPGAPSLLS